ESGNRSQIAASALMKARPATVDRLELQPSEIHGGQPLSQGALSVWTADPLLQISPVNGKVLSSKLRSEELRRGNSHFDGKSQRAVLSACKGEQVDLQIVLESSEPVQDIRITPGDLAFTDRRIGAASFTIARAWYLKSGDEWYANALPSLKANESLAIPARDN